MTVTHDSAATDIVEAGDIRFAYRRFGSRVGTPLVFLQHFTGNLDNWDPAVTDGFAQDREVIIFDNAGIASSTGTTPDTVAGMARDAVTFIEALGLEKVDLLGFSIGGMVAQQIALDRPELVRKLILVGTGPRGGEGMATFTPDVWEIFGRKRDVPDEVWLDGFFTPTPRSQNAAHSFLARIRARTQDRDVPINDLVAPAQLAAVAEWGAPREGSYDYLSSLKMPTLVVNGSNDIIIPTINSYILAQRLPDAQLILYPDGNHGSQYHDPALFVEHGSLFLDE